MGHHHHDSRHGHHHGHGHHHHGHHHHGHHHGPASHGPAFAIAVALNLALVGAQVGAGIIGHSTALLADAGHNFSDVLSLLLAWGAGRLASRPPSQRFTYGYKSTSILAALANAALLWVALGAILIETLRQFLHPQPVAAPLVMAVAGAGIVINGLSALLFMRGAKEDLNLRAAFQHLMADAAVSLGVVLAGLVVWRTGADWVDPLASLIITGLIGWGSWGLLREAVGLALQAVPEGIDGPAVRQFLAGQSGVGAVHDLHIWAMSTTETAMTAHLTMPGGHPGDPWIHALAGALSREFGIGHVTIQVETSDAAACALHPEEVV